MAIHFPADHELFACVEQEAIYWTNKERMSDEWERIKYKRRDAHLWLFGFNNDFICSAEDDRTLIALHQLSYELATDNKGRRRPQNGKIEVVFARDYPQLKFKTYDDIVKEFLPNDRTRICTQKLKVFPIYYKVRQDISHTDPVEMRIGFRLDELDRTVNLYFKVVDIKNRLPHPNFDLQTVINDLKIPDYIVKWWDIMDVEGMVRRGERALKPMPFNYMENDYYRVPSFPLIEAGVTKADIVKYWSQRPEYDFPPISNCTMCFHHTVKELQQLWRDPLAIAKMRWAREAEAMRGHTFKRHSVNGKSRPMSMQYILDLPLQTQLEFIDYASCDAGSCTD